MQIRFAASARKHRVSRPSVRWVLATTEPAEARTRWGKPGWEYRGRDHAGQELEIIAVEYAPTRQREGFLYVIHAMPVSLRRRRR